MGAPHLAPSFPILSRIGRGICALCPLNFLKVPKQWHGLHPNCESNLSMCFLDSFMFHLKGVEGIEVTWQDLAIAVL